ncbi:MAG: HD domain-containing protein [Firmicutes bacterium]|nr:HD domain-containing protein [Bacillota bacterium]
MEEVPSLVRERFARLSAPRQAHVERVAALLKALTRHHRLASPEAAWLAGYGHDLFREESRESLLAEAARLGVAVGAEEREEPILLHGPVAAAWLKQAGLGSPEVWEAVAHHTTAGPRLGGLAKALFIADGVEPGRRYPGRERLYDLAFEDLEAAWCAVVEESARYLEGRGLRLHRKMAAARAECQR